MPATGAWPRRRPALATVPAEPSSPRRAELLPPPRPGRGADPRRRRHRVGGAPTGPSHPCRCSRLGRALAAARQPHPHRGGSRGPEGAEGRREGGEKAPEEGGREEEDKAEREEREREMRGGASDLENIGREGDVGRFLSRALAPPGTKRLPFVPGGGSTRDKKATGSFVSVGAYNRDKRPLSPRWPGLSLDPGQKPHIVPGPKTAGINGLEQRPVL